MVVVVMLELTTWFGLGSVWGVGSEHGEVVVSSPEAGSCVIVVDAWPGLRWTQWCRRRTTDGYLDDPLKQCPPLTGRSRMLPGRVGPRFVHVFLTPASFAYFVNPGVSDRQPVFGGGCCLLPVPGPRKPHPPARGAGSDGLAGLGWTT